MANNSDSAARDAALEAQRSAEREVLNRPNPVPDVSIGSTTAKGTSTNPRAKLVQPGTNTGTR